MADAEEHYVLRVQDPALAERLRRVLREDPEAATADANIQLYLDGPKQHTGQRPEGRFVVGGDEYAAAMRDLPTIVETYKTYDDVNMVKCADVGQVVIVAPKGAQPPPAPASSHGLTPPMRDARRRHFRQRIEAPPHVVTRVEADLLAIIRGGAPEGVEYVDQEEQYVVDPVTGEGRWVAVGTGNVPLAPAPPPGEQVKYRKKPGPKSKKQKEAEAAAAAAAAASQADFMDDGEPSQQDFAGGGPEMI